MAEATTDVGISGAATFANPSLGYGGRRADTGLGDGEHSGSGRSNDKHLGTREPGVCARCSHPQFPTYS